MRRGFRNPGRQYLDPRVGLAQNLISQGTDISPVQHWTQGLARLASALAGKHIRGKVSDDKAAAAQAMGDFYSGSVDEEKLNEIMRENEEFGVPSSPGDRQTYADALRQNSVGDLGRMRELADNNPYARELLMDLQAQQADRRYQSGLTRAEQERQDKLLGEQRTYDLRQRDEDRQYESDQAATAFERQKELLGLTANQKDTRTSMIRNYEAAKAEGYPGTLTDFIASTRKTIQKDPRGYERTPQGLRPIQGGPEDPKVMRAQEDLKVKAKAEQKLRTAEPKIKSSLKAFNRKSQTVSSTIDKAIGLIRSGGPPVLGVTGWGNVMKVFPSSDARTLENYLDTIKANIGFDELQRMRDSSPTGGALGQVSEMENRLLQAIQGALDPMGEGAPLVENLQAIKELYPLVMQEKMGMFQEVYGYTPEINVIGVTPGGGITPPDANTPAPPPGFEVQ